MNLNKLDAEWLCVQASMAEAPIGDRNNFLTPLPKKSALSNISPNLSPSKLFDHPNLILAMKCSTQLLQQCLDKLIVRPISPSNKPGFLYDFFENSNEVKVGRSMDPVHCRWQWDVECWNPNKVWEEPIWCPYANWAGKFHFPLIM